MAHLQTSKSAGRITNAAFRCVILAYSVLLALAACTMVDSGSAVPDDTPAAPTTTQAQKSIIPTAVPVTAAAQPTAAVATAVATNVARGGDLTATVSPSQPILAEAGQPFELAVGQTALLGTENVQIELLGVSEDNRCPADVQCIIAGWVTAEVSIQIGDRAPAMVSLSLGKLAPAEEAVKIDGISFSLVDAQPYPLSTISIEPADYRISLLISVE